MFKKKLRILSIDGGGLRGIYPAYILKRIKDEFHINYSKDFDIIIGTSTGSFTASALALNIDLEKVCNLYENSAGKIFMPKNFSIKGVLKSKYKNDYFIKVLNNTFNNQKMGDAKTILIIPSTDICDGNFYIHKSPYSSKYKENENILIKDAVLSSCSAPIFFDPVLIKDGKGEKHLLADGGLWANNPSLLALIEAINNKRLNQKLKNIKILSLGTGIQKNNYKLDEKNWGAKDWSIGLINLIMSLQSQNPHKILSLLLDENQYLRINFESHKRLNLDEYRQELKSIADNDFKNHLIDIKKFFDIK